MWGKGRGFLSGTWQSFLTLNSESGLVHRCCPSVCLFVCLSVAKMQKTRFSQKLNNLELWFLLTTYRKSYMGFSKNPLRDPYNPRWLRSAILKIDMTSFFCRRWSDLDKISETGAEWHVDCGDVVEIETRCRITIWWTFGRIHWHVIPELPATIQGAYLLTYLLTYLRLTLLAATWRIRCHDSRATSHIAGCCHLVNSLSRFQSHWRNQCHDRATLQGVRIPSAILKIVFRHFYFLFLMQFRLWRAAAFVSSPIHLFERSMCDFLFSSVQTTALIFF